jgi:hypothetical protein
LPPDFSALALAFSSAFRFFSASFSAFFLSFSSFSFCFFSSLAFLAANLASSLAFLAASLSPLGGLSAAGFAGVFSATGFSSLGLLVGDFSAVLSSELEEELDEELALLLDLVPLFCWSLSATLLLTGTAGLAPLSDSEDELELEEESDAL